MTQQPQPASWSSEFASSLARLRQPFRAGAALTLFGYGCSYGYEASYSIPHADLYASPLDLLDLAALPFLSLVVALLTPFSITAASPLWYRSPIVCLGIVFLFLILVLAGRADFLEKWWAHRGLLRRTRTRKTWRGNWVLRGAAAKSLHAIVGAQHLFLVWVYLPIMLPYAGYFATLHYLRHVVDIPHSVCIADESRLPPGSGEARATSCVEIASKGEVLGRGRVVASTSRATVLFDSATKTGMAVVDKETVVRAIGLVEGAVQQTTR